MLAMSLNIISFWVINLPLAYLFAYPLGWRLEGIFLALPLGPLFETVALIIIIRKVDLKRVAKEVTDRLESVEQNLDESVDIEMKEAE